MVHAARIPAEQLPAARRRQSSPHAPYHAASASQSRWLFIPDPLITAFAHDPLAVGVYVATARLAIVARGAVPLGARDLVTWTGSTRTADRAAVMRRITKLIAAGWLSVERTSASKHRLHPTWGSDQHGVARLWQFDADDLGRPAHIRGRRVPLALLDGYIGRLDPQPGQARALVSRYLTRPLIDLTDIGVYTIGMRVEITPTPRLQHLGLASRAGMLPPLETAALLARAAAGELTTITDEHVAQVELTVQGYARLALPLAATAAPGVSAEEGGSHGESLGRSAPQRARRSDRGSAKHVGAALAEAHHDANDASGANQSDGITWDAGNHESTNELSAATAALIGGGADAQATAGRYEDDEPSNHVSADIVDGHLALNAERVLPAGEWHELLQLQQAYGATQLLIWQARAIRRASAHPFGITPAYYRACAAGDALASGQQQRPIPAELDPACDALLSMLGVRERQQLAHVPYDLVVAWRDALAHPGMAARFTAPLGFAASQMRQGNPPPDTDELERWANPVKPSGDRYESWRHIEPREQDANATRSEADIESRVRALAPPDADLATLCALARLLEAGVADAAALAQVRADTGRGAP